jgi:hypothetical protein
VNSGTETVCAGTVAVGRPRDEFLFHRPVEAGALLLVDGERELDRCAVCGDGEGDLDGLTIGSLPDVARFDTRPERGVRRRPADRRESVGSVAVGPPEQPVLLGVGVEVVVVCRLGRVPRRPQERVRRPRDEVRLPVEPVDHDRHPGGRRGGYSVDEVGRVRRPLAGVEAELLVVVRVAVGHGRQVGVPA